MARRRPVTGVLLGASVVLLTACSGGSSTSELALPESIVETTAAPIESITETPVETTQATTPATPPPTDTPEATQVPETTVEPAPETTAPRETTTELTIEEQINRDLALGEEALAAAAAEPGSTEARNEVARFFGGENLPSLFSLYDQLVENGWIGIPNPETRSFTVLVSDVEDNDSQTTATATICRVDSGIVLDPGDPKTPNDDFIINGIITRYIFVVDLEFMDGHWKLVRNVENISETVGATRCEV